METADATDRTTRSNAGAEATFRKPLVIAFDKGYAPLTLLDIDGNPTGIFVDFWRLWSQKTGKGITFITGNWNSTLINLKNSKADIHSGLFYSDSRAKWIRFSQPFYGVGSHLFCKAGSNRIDLRGDLAGIKIGATSGSFQEEYLHKKYPGAEVVPFPNRERMIRAVLEMEIDCLLAEGPSTAANLNRLGLTGQFKTSRLLFQKTFHAGVLKENAALLLLIDKGFDTISDMELAAIEKRWLPDSNQQYYRTPTGKIRLTDKEKAWLARHPSIRVGFPSNFPPLFFKEAAVIKGINPDHLSLISTYSGLNFDPIIIPAKKLDDYLQSARIDMSVAFDIPERKNYALNTLAGMHMNMVVIGRNDMQVISGLAALNGEKIAVVRGIRIYNRVLKDYPDIKIYQTDTYAEALAAVVSEKADAILGGMVMFGHLLHRYPTLKILGPAGIPAEPYMYTVRKDYPELVSIMNKAITKIPREETDAIVQKWFKVQIDLKKNWATILTWVGGVGLASVVVIGIFLFSNRKLSREIIERRKVEAALKESEEKYRLIIDNQKDMVVKFDPDGRLQFVSPSYCATFGKTQEQLLGKKFMPLIHVDDREIVAEALARAFKPPYFAQVEERALTQAGWRWQEWQNVAILNKDNKVEAIVASGRNVDERKKAEAALVKSEQQFQELFTSINDLIYTLDLKGQFISVNPAILEAFGYEYAELIGRKVSDFMAPELAATFESDYLETLQLQGYHEGIAIYFTKNGEKIFIENKSAFVWPADGDPFISGIGRDVTEKILSERSVAKLQQQVAQSQKLESIGTLTGGIAHDFNNIQAIIAGNTELALKDVPEWNPAYACLEEIKTASLRATKIVKQLLNFSRKTDSKLQPIEIALIVKSALKFLRSTIPTTIDIQHEIQAANETMLADPAQINQIMMNLCINASHAMEQTGGKITIKLEKVMVDDTATKDYPALKSGKHAKLTVSDTGPGIDPEIIDRIFDPYFTTKEVGKGSGMGLTVAHGIVKNHNGVISVESEPGKGTVFEVLFPLTEAEAEQVTGEPEEVPTGNGNILFVDDEASLVKMVKRSLELQGHRVETKSDPAEALELFRSKPDWFDLIITDMTMPNMTGDRFAIEILSIRPDIPIILCSGFSEKIDAEKAKALGIRKYIEKPLDMFDFVASIRKVLDAGRSETEIPLEAGMS